MCAWLYEYAYEIDDKIKQVLVAGTVYLTCNEDSSLLLAGGENYVVFLSCGVDSNG